MSNLPKETTGPAPAQETQPKTPEMYLEDLMALPKEQRALRLYFIAEVRTKSALASRSAGITSDEIDQSFRMGELLIRQYPSLISISASFLDLFGLVNPIIEAHLPSTHLNPDINRYIELFTGYFNNPNYNIEQYIGHEIDAQEVKSFPLSPELIEETLRAYEQTS